ncbi:sugar transferase [uncultured Duncaniella sp.]|uniref:sugar transferase n=1 Tax=uncultured Duncaniella sp. TaxID=2768039 RepID=UPI00267513CE|nr:sugar transferase [uncultured Duncaniella sp.]
MTREGRLRIGYVLVDYLCTLIGVVMFSVLRLHIQHDASAASGDIWPFMILHHVVAFVLIFPLFMLLIYSLTGFYVYVTDKSRIKELAKTFEGVILGAIFFSLALFFMKDASYVYRFNYGLILLFSGILFVSVFIGRVCLTTCLLKRRGKDGAYRCGVLVIGNTNTPEENSGYSSIALRHGIYIRRVVSLGEMNDVVRMVSQGEVDCVMMSNTAMNSQGNLSSLNRLYSLDVSIFVSPDDRALIMGLVRYDNVIAEPLVDLACLELPDKVVALKRFMDIIASFIGLVICLPVMAVLSCAIKIQSSGPVIYSQERIGFRKRPFMLFKLRSMRMDAESAGPSLTVTNDERVTPVGRFMRKYRLDEIPNLWNVMKGEMSIVGPRPERQYYIDQIIKQAPHYTLIHQVRPGLTSWGMVKYGYACDVSGMVERLKYDILYLRNMSLSLDLRIIYHTLFTVIRGEGK